MKLTDAEILAMDNATWITWQPEDAEPVKLGRIRPTRLTCVACGGENMTDCCEDGTGFCHSSACRGARQAFRF